MTRLIDLTGQRFGRLTVIERAPSAGRHPRWLCECECGASIVAYGSNLKRGRTQSCGCLHREGAAAMMLARRTHQRTRTPEWWTWQSMKQRCLNPNHAAYRHYGGRGILIHPAWIRSFEAFYAYVGDRPSPNHSLDRIDNDGNYEPGNVRWATIVQQNNNSRNANRAKTHCPHGHPYDAENTHRNSQGWRWCKACWRRRAARQKACERA